MKRKALVLRDDIIAVSPLGTGTPWNPKGIRVDGGKMGSKNSLTNLYSK